MSASGLARNSAVVLPWPGHHGSQPPSPPPSPIRAKWLTILPNGHTRTVPHTTQSSQRSRSGSHTVMHYYDLPAREPVISLLRAAQPCHHGAGAVYRPPAWHRLCHGGQRWGVCMGQRGDGGKGTHRRERWRSEPKRPRWRERCCFVERGAV